MSAVPERADDKRHEEEVCQQVLKEFKKLFGQWKLVEHKRLLAGMSIGEALRPLRQFEATSSNRGIQKFLTNANQKVSCRTVDNWMNVGDYRKEIVAHFGDRLKEVGLVEALSVVKQAKLREEIKRGGFKQKGMGWENGEWFIRPHNGGPNWEAGRESDKGLVMATTLKGVWGQLKERMNAPIKLNPETPPEVGVPPWVPPEGEEEEMAEKGEQEADWTRTSPTGETYKVHTADYGQWYLDVQEPGKPWERLGLYERKDDAIDAAEICVAAAEITDADEEKDDDGWTDYGDDSWAKGDYRITKKQVQVKKRSRKMKDSYFVEKDNCETWDWIGSFDTLEQAKNRADQDAEMRKRQEPPVTVIKGCYGFKIVEGSGSLEFCAETDGKVNRYLLTGEGTCCVRDKLIEALKPRLAEMWKEIDNAARKGG